MFNKKYECLWCDKEVELGIIDRVMGKHMSTEICDQCSKEMQLISTVKR